jgi:hypothetical protein
MGTVSGQGTTFNLPNYVGELFAVTPTDTPFLSAIGGLSGGKSVSSYIHQWQTFDLRTAAQNVALEGAAAPTAQERSRSNVVNVAQIHHEAVEISYTKLAATQQFDDVGAGNTAVEGIGGMNPITNELDWQVSQALAQIARDVEYSFIRGTFSDPATNATARQTRGILEAISTNAVSNGGAALNRNTFYAALELIFESGGVNDGTITCIANSTVTLALNDIFVEDMGAGFQQTDRNVGGVDLKMIVTPFGNINVMMNRHMPTDQLAVVKLSECAPFFLNIPGKGFLFAEPVALAGASQKVQIYGEIGLEYGNEKSHAKITGIPDSFGTDS